MIAFVVVSLGIGGVSSLLHRGTERPAEVAQPSTPLTPTIDQWQAGYQAGGKFMATWRCDTLVTNLADLLDERHASDFLDGCYQHVSENRQPDAMGHSGAWQDGYAQGPYTIEPWCEQQAQFLANKMHQIAPSDIGSWAAGCLAWNHEHPEANA